MTEFIETIKNIPKTQKRIDLVVESYSLESHKTQLQKVLMEETLEKMAKRTA